MPNGTLRGVRGRGNYLIFLPTRLYINKSAFNFIFKHNDIFVIINISNRTLLLIKYMFVINGELLLWRMIHYIKAFIKN